MPKCINNTAKSYTGREPSPKGLGYTASSEKVGKKMKGTDENIWIVTQTKTCLKWIKEKNNIKIDTNLNTKSEPKSEPESESEPEPKSDSESNFTINFDNLDRSFYEYVYFPITSKIKIENETGLEEKFGGSVPFFIEGETWPEYNKIPMTFFGQIKDPRKKNSILYRLFFAIDGNFLDRLDKIELNKENLQKQIKIEKPTYNINNDNKEIELTSFIPYKINKWNKKLELKSFDYIIKGIDIPLDVDLDELRNMYYDSKYLPSSSIKVGGTPAFTQSFDEKMINKYNFLQLSGEKILDFCWGDCGIAHITEDCELYWDCS